MVLVKFYYSVVHSVFLFVIYMWVFIMRILRVHKVFHQHLACRLTVWVAGIFQSGGWVYPLIGKAICRRQIFSLVTIIFLAGIIQWHTT